MKNKLMLRLCLMTIAWLSLHSCRQDIVPEQETYNNTSAFQLTSKRISLDEAKHKTKLVTQLEKAKADLKVFAKSNTHGKLVSYGNNFSIDTENVTYIENGPNFHTYTFNIIRENALPTDPVENLVLAPMTDGTYKELLITYHLTAAEKQTLMNGGFVDTKGKTTVTAISTGNYSSVLAKTQSCSYETITINISCSSGEHMPGQSGCKLTGNDRAKMYQVVGLVCSGDDGSGGSSGGGGGGSGGGGEGGGEPCPDCPTYGGGTPTEPCNGNGVATSPLDPTTDIGDSSSCTGVPTLPNVDDGDTDLTPCETLIRNEQKPGFQNKLDSLMQRVLPTTPNYDKHETQVTVKKSFDNFIYSVSSESTDVGGPQMVGVTGTSDILDVADIHNHYPGLCPIFSNGDIASIYDTYKFVKPSRQKVYTSYLVNFNGTTYAMRINDISFLDTLFAGINLGTLTTTNPDLKKGYDKVLEIFDKYGDQKVTTTQAAAEKLYMKVLNDAKLGGGNAIHLYRKDADGWGKLNMDANGTITKENCP